ncbi:MAG TPA: Arc family DNA-binding protein [Candidatus Acidoferrum sp.]|nr:Arc family DNA-binding protein [Candidatus Acidoferrum sp.]
MSNDSLVEVQVQAQDDQKSGPSLVEKFVIRLPLGLRDQIRQLSETNRRSMNSEIIMVLESHIRQQLLQQMAEASGDDRIQPVQDRTESELERRLQNLPHDKKAALLQLLG